MSVWGVIVVVGAVVGGGLGLGFFIVIMKLINSGVDARDEEDR